MTASKKAIRKRLLECMERRELEKLSHWELAPHRGRDTIIAYILDGHWSTECDRAVTALVHSVRYGLGDVTLPKDREYEL